MAKFLRVTRSFSTDIDGVPTAYGEGQIVSADDPAVKGRADFFEDIQKHAERVTATETATAAPGERRSLRDTLGRSKKRALKTAEAANRTGADDGEPDPESGSNQVPGVNRKDGSDPDSQAGAQTAEQKRSAKAAMAVAEAVNRVGADDGEPDPESGSSQVPGVNRLKGHEEPEVAPSTNEDKDTPADIQKLAEESNRVGADDGEADPESGSNQVPGVNRVDPNDPDLPVDDEPAGKKEPVKAPAQKPAKKTAAKKTAKKA